MGLLSIMFGSTAHSPLIEAIKGGAFLVDVRTASEFSRGSVEGAVNIPLDQMQSQLAKFKDKKVSLSSARAATVAARQNISWNKTVFKMC